MDFLLVDVKSISVTMFFRDFLYNGEKDIQPNQLLKMYLHLLVKVKRYITKY